MRPWGSIKLDIYGGSHEKRMGLTMELPKVGWTGKSFPGTLKGAGA